MSSVEGSNLNSKTLGMIENYFTGSKEEKEQKIKLATEQVKNLVDLAVKSFKENQGQKFRISESDCKLDLERASKWIANELSCQGFDVKISTPKFEAVGPVDSLCMRKIVELNIKKTS